MAVTFNPGSVTVTDAQITTAAATTQGTAISLAKRLCFTESITVDSKAVAVAILTEALANVQAL